MYKTKRRSSAQQKKISSTANTKTDPEKRGVIYLYPTLAIISINILIVVAIIVFISAKLPPQVPLYYGLPRGERQLANPVLLILPVSLASLFITTNTIIAYFTKKKFLKNFLVVLGFFSTLFSIFIMLKIIFLFF